VHRKTERGAYDVRVKFLELAEQVRLIFLRNGAFLFNIDENLEYPGTLRTETLLSSWAEHLLQLSRMTKSESEIYHSALAMHAGGCCWVQIDPVSLKGRAFFPCSGQLRKSSISLKLNWTSINP
jgi:Transmembrane secretion effector